MMRCTLMIPVMLMSLTAALAAPPENGLEGELVWQEDFSDGMDNWWVEGGKRVWVEGGRLHVDADTKEPGMPGYSATVWCETPVPGDVRVELDAHVVHSHIGANNINTFLHYSDPSGKTLYETRDQRSDANYNKYKPLNGYIFTFLRDWVAESDAGQKPDGRAKARFRMRRCPGFNLIDQNYDGTGCRQGVTYHITITITKRDGRLIYAVEGGGYDGGTYLKTTDDNPHGGGLLGLRTFCTHLWWDNIRVYSLENTKSDDRNAKP